MKPCINHLCLWSLSLGYECTSVSASFWCIGGNWRDIVRTLAWSLDGSERKLQSTRKEPRFSKKISLERTGDEAWDCMEVIIRRKAGSNLCNNCEMELLSYSDMFGKCHQSEA